MGVYSSLRVLLDYANWSSLGVGLGAVQEIPILRAAGKEAEARRVADVAYTATTLLCLAYAAGLLAWSAFLSRTLGADPLASEWAGGLAIVAGLAILHRYQTFLIAVLRAHQEFAPDDGTGGPRFDRLRRAGDRRASGWRACGGSGGRSGCSSCSTSPT